MAAQAPGGTFSQQYPESVEGLFLPSLCPLNQQGKPLPEAPAQAPLVSHWPESPHVPMPKPIIKQRGYENMVCLDENMVCLDQLCHFLGAETTYPEEQDRSAL